MWMTDYIKAVKRGFRDQHKIRTSGGTEDEPIFENIPDGEYPMEIEGRTDYVRMNDGRMSICRWKP